MASHNTGEGKVALITGSTREDGFGYEIARSLARNGYSIILQGRRDGADIEALRKQIESEYKVPTHYLKADLLHRSEIEKLCKDIEAIYPNGLDVLVNNAGMLRYGTIEKHSTEDWDNTIKLNLTAPFDLIRLTLGGMKKKGWGRIINISSILSKKTVVTLGAYVSAKHGLNGLTKTVANDTFGTGVTCNAICPAFADTVLAVDVLKEGAVVDGIPYETYLNGVLGRYNPSGPFVKKEQIAEFAAFLCSSAADQMTGATIPIDAGCWAT